MNLFIQLIQESLTKLIFMSYRLFSVFLKNSKLFFKKIKHLFKQILFCIYLNLFFKMNLAMILFSLIYFKIREFGRFKSMNTFKMLIFRYQWEI
jgi:hypothetical protein